MDFDLFNLFNETMAFLRDHKWWVAACLPFVIGYFVLRSRA